MLFWLIDHLQVSAGDSVFVAIARETNETFHLSHRLRAEYPKLDIRLIDLMFETRGASVAPLIGLNAQVPPRRCSWSRRACRPSSATVGPCRSTAIRSIGRARSCCSGFATCRPVRAPRLFSRMPATLQSSPVRSSRLSASLTWRRCRGRSPQPRRRHQGEGRHLAPGQLGRLRVR